MKKFIKNVLKEYKALSPLQKLIRVIIPFLGLILAVLGVWATYDSQKEKINKTKDTQRQQINEATRLASDLLDEIRTNLHPELPEDFKKAVASIRAEDLSQEVSFDKLDMNIQFRFSTDDYKAFLQAEVNYDVGQYQLTSQTGYIITKVLETILEQKLSHFLDKMEIKTKIKGIADGVPVIPDAVYKGEEVITSIRYWNVNENAWKTASFMPDQTKLDNEKIAFLRAYFVSKYIRSLQRIKNSSVKISVEEVKEVGPRKAILAIEIKVKNALQDTYNELGFFEKKAFDLSN